MRFTLVDTQTIPAWGTHGSANGERSPGSHGRSKRYDNLRRSARDINSAWLIQISCQEISVGITVGCYVTPYHVALRIESICLGQGRAWNINRDELPLAQHKTVLLSIFAVIEPNNVTLRVYASDPR